MLLFVSDLSEILRPILKTRKRGHEKNIENPKKVIKEIENPLSPGQIKGVFDCFKDESFSGITYFYCTIASIHNIKRRKRGGALLDINNCTVAICLSNLTDL